MCFLFGFFAAPQQKKHTSHQDFLQRPPAFSSLLRDLGLIESEERTAADAVAEARIWFLKLLAGPSQDFWFLEVKQFAPENKPGPKRKVIFQPLFAGGYVKL